MATKKEQERIEKKKDEITKDPLKESPESVEKYDERDEENLESFPASDPPSHTPPKKD